jgi:hypothetical protein
VVAPLCKAYLKKNGWWSAKEMPVTPGMDTEYQSHQYDATGRLVSDDQPVGPSTSLQWISDHGWTNSEGVRLSKGGVYYIAQWRNASRKYTVMGSDQNKSLTTLKNVSQIDQC